MKTANERRLLDLIQTVGGKFKIRYIGHKFSFIALKINNQYYLGEAVCHDEDQFCRRIGRECAMGRAWKDYLLQLYVPKDMVPRPILFKEDAQKVG